MVASLDKIASILKEYEPPSFGQIKTLRNTKIELAVSQKNHEKIRSLLRNSIKTEDDVADMHCHRGQLKKKAHSWYVRCNDYAREMDIDAWLRLPPSLPAPSPPPPPTPQQQPPAAAAALPPSQQY